MKRVRDGQIDFSGGQHNGVSPAILPEHFYAQAINCSARNGVIAPRKPRQAIPFSRNTWQIGNFQGAYVYESLSGSHIVVAVNGHLWELWPKHRTINRITTDSVHLSPNVDEIFLVQAGRFLLAQDGVNSPLVVDDSSVEISLSVPVGRNMAFGAGRLYVVSPSRTVIEASRISSGAYSSDDFLIFDESGNLSPYDIGPCTGLIFLPVLDTGTGLGALIAFGTTGLYSFNVGIPRDLWPTSELGRLIASNLNRPSIRSAVPIGGDLFFATATGITSLSTARADFRAARYTDISKPVQGWINQTPEDLLPYASASFFDQQYRLAFLPERLPSGNVRFYGQAVLDFQHGIATDPTFTSAESGIYVQAQLVDNDRLYLIGKDSSGENTLYQDLESGTDDIRSDGTRSRIPWMVETRAYVFDSIATRKHLQGGAFLDLAGIRGPIELDIYFRVNRHPKWQHWMHLNADPCQAEGLGCSVKMGSKGYARIFLPSPEQTEDNCTGQLLSDFNEIQIRFVGLGYMKLERWTLAATSEEETYRGYEFSGPDLDCLVPCTGETSLLRHSINPTFPPQPGQLPGYKWADYIGDKAEQSGYLPDPANVWIIWDFFDYVETDPDTLEVLGITQKTSGAYPGTGQLETASPTLIPDGLMAGKDSALWSPGDALRSVDEHSWGAIPVWPNVEPFTVYAVVKPAAFELGKRTILSTQDGALSISRNADESWSIQSGGDEVTVATGADETDSWVLVCAVFDGTNSLIQIGLNPAEFGPLPDYDPSGGGANASPVMGQEGTDPATSWEGELAQIIIRLGADNVATRNAYMVWLATVHQINLSPRARQEDHAAVSTRLMGSYNPYVSDEDHAGVRTALSGLYQIQFLPTSTEEDHAGVRTSLSGAYTEAVNPAAAQADHAGVSTSLSGAYVDIHTIQNPEDAIPGYTLHIGTFGQWTINGVPIVGETGTSFLVPMNVSKADAITQDGATNTAIVLHEYLITRDNQLLTERDGTPLYTNE